MLKENYCVKIILNVNSMYKDDTGAIYFYACFSSYFIVYNFCCSQVQCLDPNHSEFCVMSRQVFGFFFFRMSLYLIFIPDNSLLNKLFELGV